MVEVDGDIVRPQLFEVPAELLPPDLVLFVVFLENGRCELSAVVACVFQ